MEDKKMEEQTKIISVVDLTEKITQLIKEEIVAICKKEESELQMYFVNGQVFRIAVEEIR